MKLIKLPLQYTFMLDQFDILVIDVVSILKALKWFQIKHMYEGWTD